MIAAVFWSDKGGKLLGFWDIMMGLLGEDVGDMSEERVSEWAN